MIVILGLTAFVVALVIHILWWRFATPSATGKALICLFSLVVPLATTGIAAPCYMLSWGVFEGYGIFGEVFYATLLGLAVAAAYVMTYPAIEVTSPTLKMIELVAAREPRGIDAAEFRAIFDDSRFIVPRLENLLEEGLIMKAGDAFALTAKGARLAMLFIGWRRLLRGPLGG